MPIQTAGAPAAHVLEGCLSEFRLQEGDEAGGCYGGCELILREAALVIGVQVRIICTALVFRSVLGSQTHGRRSRDNQPRSMRRKGYRQMPPIR